MNQVELYAKNNSLQKTDAAFVIDNFLRLVKWQPDRAEAVLDVGCGDGGVLLELLLPKLPKNVRRIVGVDVSAEMVQFASGRRGRGQCAFAEFDVAATDVPDDFHAGFDHIFSFYCLHWVTEQRQALKNLFEMLKPGGDMLLTFLASNPIYDIYERMAQSVRWLPFMDDLECFIPPFQHSPAPEREFEALLKEAGFCPHLCRVEDRTYVFPNFALLRKAVAAVDPFIQRIPENLVDNYVEDYFDKVRTIENITIENCNNNNEESIKMHYKLFIVFASKTL